MKQIAVWALFVAGAAAIAISAGSALGRIFTQPDAEWYLQIARGKTPEVLLPFAARQMAPLVCQALTNVLHVSVYAAFLIEGVVALLALLGFVGFLLMRARANGIVFAAIGGLAFWSILFNGLALPDLWYAALLAGFLVLLAQKHFLASALMMFPLFFSRESTILALFCLFVAGWRRMRPLDYAVAAIASFAGMRLVKYLTLGGLSNREQISPLLYMAAKVPWNFAKNILGIPPWNNLNQLNCVTPRWQTALHIGGVTSVGVCEYNPAAPLWTLMVALSSFGLLPLLFLFLVWKKQFSFRAEGVMLRFCLLYGAVALLLAPVLGVAVLRLTYYAWPLFVVAVPILAVRHLVVPRWPAILLVCAHLAIAWSVMLYRNVPLELAREAVLLLAIGATYACGLMLLRRGKFV